jgi:predicted ester cyclase
MSPAEITPARPTQSPAAPDDPKAVSVRLIRLMADGDLPGFESVIHRDGTNREAHKEPIAARGKGPAAFYASALWLRCAFSEMRWDIHEVAADGDLVVVHSTLSARHTGSFATYDGAGAVSQVMPPTGKAFAATQTHWFRHADGKIIEHWANRDDLAVAQQAGWVPPSPRYLARMALAKRRARAAAT